MNYETIKIEYETTKTSFKKLSDKHETHYKTLERRAKKEGWIKFNPKNIIPTSPKITTSSIPIIKPQIIADSTKVSEDIKTFLKSYHRPIDDILIMTYVDSYIAYTELQQEVKSEGRYILSPKGSQYMNPKYSGLQMEKMNLIKIGKELGVTLSSRIRLHLDLEEENKQQSIFDYVDSVMNESIDI